MPYTVHYVGLTFKYTCTSFAAFIHKILSFQTYSLKTQHSHAVLIRVAKLLSIDFHHCLPVIRYMINIHCLGQLIVKDSSHKSIYDMMKISIRFGTCILEYAIIQEQHSSTLHIFLRLLSMLGFCVGISIVRRK